MNPVVLRSAWFGVLVCATLLVSCRDNPAGPGDRVPPPVSPNPGAVQVAEVSCSANLATGAVSCGEPAAPGGASRDLIVGGQGVFVQLTSTSTAVVDVPDPAVRDTFRLHVTVQNLIPQALGTSDGVTAHAGGVRVFFSQLPTATGGSGQVVVANPTGWDTFLQSSMPFFQYAGKLETGATSEPLHWKMAFDPGVTQFAFKVYVASVVQYPQGWVSVEEPSLSLDPGQSGTLTATVRDAVGRVVEEPVTWSSSVPGVVGVSAAGQVSATCGGQTLVSASTATRPARMAAAVRVTQAAWSSFSPSPYGAAGSTVPRTASLSAVFDRCVGASASTFVVQGMQSPGTLLGGSLSGVGTGTITYGHTHAFFPGEEVEVSLTGAIASTPRVARFRVAAGAASGAFPDVTYATGPYPTDVVAADLNGDGRLDLATSLSAGTVSVLFRNASGDGFEPRVDLTAGLAATKIVSGDLNGDGRLDLATLGANTVSVLFRNAANTGFEPNVDYATASNARALAIGDLNGDGRLDLATASSNTSLSSPSTVSVLLRNAANTGFEPKVDYVVSNSPVAIAIGDLNGDGRPDVATANYGSNYGSSSVSVLLRNAANSGFEPRVDYTVSDFPSSIAIGDLNGDGRPDLAGGATAYGNSRVFVLARNATNTGFVNMPLLSVDYLVNPVVIGDLNEDGRLDLVTANAKTLTVLLRNAANTGFEPRVDYATLAGPNSKNSVAIGDLNGDGRPDLASANNRSNTISVFLQNSTSTGFGPMLDHATDQSPSSVAVADLNGDGRLDVATANDGSNTVSVLLRNAANTGFASKVDYATASYPYAIVARDLNGDGRLDLVTANSGSNTVSVLLRNAANTGFDPRVDHATGSTPWSLAVGDLNGDGQPDLATVNRDANTVSVLLRNAANTGFDPRVDYPTNSQAWGLAIGDVNGDGRMDLVTANDNVNLSSPSAVSVLLRNAANTGFEPRVDYPVGTGMPSLAVGDLNGDGRPDVAGTNWSQGIVFVLLRNAANTGFEPAVGYATGEYPWSVSIGDLNGDGRLDLITTNFHSNAVTVLLRNAANTGFEPKVPYTTGSSPAAAGIGDVNGDGRLDLVVANRAANSVRVLENQP